MSVVPWLLGVTSAAAAVFGGAMFAFSAFVIPALRDLDPRDGIVAMQAINVRAPRSLLLLPMGLLTLGSVAVVLVELVGDGGGRPLEAFGGVLGLAAIVITGVGNVPRNNRLAALDANSHEAEGEWSAFVRDWNRWNHLRTLASIAAAILLAIASCA